MNNITKYNIKTLAISVAGLILLFCVLSYLTAPQSDTFQIESISPFGILEGTAFALSFGLGFPVWLSIITIAAISFLIFMVFLWVARRVVHHLNALKHAACDLLMSEARLEHRSKRPIEPEAVFGHIKECGQFRRFRLRGIAGASLEFGLKALAHNLRKMAALTFAKLFFRLFSAPKRPGTIKLLGVSHLRLAKVA